MIKYDLYNSSVRVKEDIRSGYKHPITDLTHKNYYIKIRNGKDSDTKQSNTDIGWPRKEITHHIRIRVQTTGAAPSGFPTVMTIKSDGIDNWYTVESIGNEHDTLNDIVKLTTLSNNIKHMVFEKALGLKDLSRLFKQNYVLVSFDLRAERLTRLNLHTAFHGCTALTNIGFHKDNTYFTWHDWVLSSPKIQYVTAINNRVGTDHYHLVGMVSYASIRPNRAERESLLATHQSWDCGGCGIFPTPPPTSN